MTQEPSVAQIRQFRLHSHHLDRTYQKNEIIEVVGACGMQNSPPSAWETALFNRIPNYHVSEMQDLLYKDKVLVQAWSIRGAPMVFPTSQSDVFLASLCSRHDEPWIYTNGISLALDFLQMNFDDVFALVKHVIPNLDNHTLLSKTTLDQTLAAWISPLLPNEKRDLWEQPSMYGNPLKQSVGGAVVSFLLRPCSFQGCVVFGERQQLYPTFTSYKQWIGHSMHIQEHAQKELVRKYIHCYGPTSMASFITWLGCSKKQGQRMWNAMIDELKPVMVAGKQLVILSSDEEQLFTPVSFPRELLLLGGHDPYLDQRDRHILQPDTSLHKQIWKMVSNPGAIVYRGEIIGIWTSKRKGMDLEMRITLWNDSIERKRLYGAAEEYAEFRQQRLLSVTFERK